MRSRGEIHRLRIQVVVGGYQGQRAGVINGGRNFPLAEMVPQWIALFSLDHVEMKNMLAVRPARWNPDPRDP